MAIFNNCLSCCFLSKSSYSKLCMTDSNEYELTDTYVHYTIKNVFFVDKISHFNSDVKQSSIGFDHIIIGQYSIKYDYIAFFRTNNNAIYIFLFGEIIDNQIHYCDKPMFIKLILPSYSHVSMYMKRLLSTISKYKKLNTYDFSAKTFNSFTNIKI